MKTARLVTFTIVASGLFALWVPAAPAVTHTVKPGDSIQEAIDAAAPGDTVKVLPGDYLGVPAGTAAVRITKPLKFIAKSNLKKGVKVRILPGSGNTDGIVVEPPNPSDPDVFVDGVTIKGFTVEGFTNNGIWLKQVRNFKILGNESINNLENGIWPTLSANGLVKKNVAYGSEDSALWVEASENVRVFKNEFYHSPTGLEITVSKNVVAKKNNIHHNSIGIGLYHPSGASLPPLGDDGDWEIIGNYVHDNNEPNIAPPGSMSAELPPGGGILILGVDRVTVRKNRIENNGFFGVGVVDYCVAVAGTDFDCVLNPPEVEPAPDNNEITGNALWNNGGIPPGGIFDFLAADLAYLAPPVPPITAGGTNNCFSDNIPDTLTSVFVTPNQCN